MPALLIAFMIIVGVPTPTGRADQLSDHLVYGPKRIGDFGTYSAHYLNRRWQRMCKGPQRYEAMREAYEHGRPPPCK